MGQGYTRNDTGNNIADGNIINAADLDGEFDAVEAAFNETTGHTHDGTAAEGAPITVLGPVQDFIASATEIKPKTTNTLDIGTAALQFKDMYLDGAAYIGNISVDGNTISSTDTNGNITLAPNGTGVVALSSTDLTFGDNDKAIFGAGSDLQIYHDGSHSVINEQGTGNLKIIGSDISIEGSGETYATFADDGAVTLYHDNAAKLATTASGCDITGAISSNKGSAGTLATFTDGVNSNFVVETSSLLTTIGNGGGSAALALKANNTEAMRITSGGNVGIGGSDVQLFNGVGGSMKLVVIGDDSTTTVANNSDAGIAIVNTNQTAGNLAGLHFARADTDNSPNYAGASIVAQFPDAQVTGQYPKGELAFLTSTATNSAPSEKMRIDSSGDVGIGTTTNNASGATKSVALNASSGMAAYEMRTADSFTGYVGNDGTNMYLVNAVNGSLGFYTNNSERMRIDSSGKVGIGTSSTNYGKFTVQNTAGTGKVLLDSYQSVPTTENVMAIYADASNGYIESYNNGYKNIIIAGSGGNVGIGTSSISGKLSINGEVYAAPGSASGVAYGFYPRGAYGNTGMFSPAPNTVAFATTGGERMRIDSNGNVGIGVTSMTNKLVLPNAAYFAMQDTGGAESLAIRANTSNAMEFLTGGGEKMRITSAGNVGIGHSTPQFGLTMAQGNGDAARIGWEDGSNNKRASIICASSSDALQFHTGTSDTERMRIDSSGNLQLGYGGQTTTAFAAPQGITIASLDNVAIQYFLRKGNQVEAHIGFKSSTDSNFYVGTGGGPGPGGIGVYGVYQANNATSWSAVSDETQKTIVGNIENASEKVSTLRTVMGYYNTDETETNKPFLIAQDVQAVLPEAVSIADVETGVLGLSYTDVIPLLTAAIKEQRTMIQELEARIAALEAN